MLLTRLDFDPKVGRSVSSYVRLVQVNLIILAIVPHNS